jgi:ferredoxin
MTLSIDYGLCAGCGACAERYPLFFELRDEKAWIINYDQFHAEEHKDLPSICPYRAITLE